MEVEDVPAALPASTVEQVIERLPKVTILADSTPTELQLGRFLAAMVTCVLAAMPVNMHENARAPRASASVL